MPQKQHGVIRARTPWGRLAILVAICITCGYFVGEGKGCDGITRRPPPADYSFLRVELTELPGVEASPSGGFPLDLRHQDLTAVDLREHGQALLDQATFDDQSRWPRPGRMPAIFDPDRVLELGKNPGLGIRGLHKKGITGRGIAIGIVDQTLLTDHVEYAGRIRLYEEIGSLRRMQDGQAAMHGCALASIAAGKTIGVAPDAEVYYVGASAIKLGAARKDSGRRERDFRGYAQAVRRLVEINESLPPRSQDTGDCTGDRLVRAGNRL